MLTDELLSVAEAVDALGIRPWILRPCFSDRKIRLVHDGVMRASEISLATRMTQLRRRHISRAFSFAAAIFQSRGERFYGRPRCRLGLALGFAHICASHMAAPPFPLTISQV